jgi:hypothetical protein
VQEDGLGSQGLYVGEVDFPLSSRFRFLFTRAPSYSACTASVTRYGHSLLGSSPAAMRIPIKLPRVLPGIRAIPQAMRLRARRQGVNQINCCVLSPPLATSAPLDSFDLGDRCACVGPKDNKKNSGLRTRETVKPLLLGQGGVRDLRVPSEDRGAVVTIVTLVAIFY